ncbi:actin filament-associated protein 1-like 2 isoform X3 [Ctenopharyngodon idella]|uniref:actin filament-associated protein 1-like 2 isoform X3 n=1 Tax=Ctenopharyngodon idella TaxID=7959 RepID=UPI002231064A|nr:actin filament-associated protein 1-like 2 isoform X3 [Ctenopharyngodon idella]
MDKQKVLARLVSDLQAFLLVLDSENLSYIAQAQKKSISELLYKLQDNKDTPAEDAEYMIMNCPSGGPSDLRESTTAEAHLTEEPLSVTSTERLQQGHLLFRTPATLHSPRQSVCPAAHIHDLLQPPAKQRTSISSAVPPHPPCLEDEDCYEEAEPFVPASQTTDKVDSDSSHYESYGEEEEEFVKDRAHYIQWSSSQPCLRPVPESRICGYLWRKKWLGQWTRQLFIIKHDSLLCFKCAKDLHPLLELNLTGCYVVYKSKNSKKMQHELKVVANADTVILGFQSSTQAEEWRKIIEEVSGSSYYEPESQSSSSILRSERLDSCRSSTVLHTDSDEEKISSLPSAISSVEIKDKDRAAFLNVLMNCQWQSLWCRVEDGVLKMYRDEESEETPQYTVQLRGSEVRPGPDTAHAYRITITQHGDQVAVLEANCADDKEQWVQLLQDGSSTVAGSPYQHTSHESLSGLKSRKFPTSNMYMDDPFQQLCGGIHSQPIYSNSSILEHMFQKPYTGGNGELVSSKDSANYSNNEIFSNHSTKVFEIERGVQKLDLTGKSRVQLRAGSEINLVSVGTKPAKRNSFRRSLAFCTERAQGGFLTPLLRRTASAKSTLKKAPSALFIEHGRVFQRRKEWETKASG